MWQYICNHSPCVTCHEDVKQQNARILLLNHRLLHYLPRPNFLSTFRLHGEMCGRIDDPFGGRTTSGLLLSPKTRLKPSLILSQEEEFKIAVCVSQLPIKWDSVVKGNKTVVRESLFRLCLKFMWIQSDCESTQIWSDSANSLVSWFFSLNE